MGSDTENSNQRKEFTGTKSPPGDFRRFIRVMFGRRLVLFGIVIIIVLLLTAALAPFIAPYNPYKQNLSKTLQLPSSRHLLGTDALGRDLLSRIIYGSRTSLMVGIFSTFIAAGLGMLLGVLAGYLGSLANNIIMRFIDAIMAIPSLILTLAIAAILGGGLKNIIIALSFGIMPTYCRLMCGQVLSIRESDYISAARALGSSDFGIMFRHILPNAFPPLLVLITLNLGFAILAEAGLSFIGVGIAPPGAAWGAMVNDGYKYVLTNPLLSFSPGIAIILVVLSFNMVGDGLRDALDPRLRGII